MQLYKVSLHTSTHNTDFFNKKFFFRVCLTFCSFVFTAVLLFGGEMQVNPAHPKQIGSIDPYCHVTDVVKGRSLRIIQRDHGLSQLYFRLALLMSCLASLFKTVINLIGGGKKCFVFFLQMHMKMLETYVTDTT